MIYGFIPIILEEKEKLKDDSFHPSKPVKNSQIPFQASYTVNVL